jgi:hypothetical protein
MIVLGGMVTGEFDMRARGNTPPKANKTRLK